MPTADFQCVGKVVGTVESHWTWRLSARCRIASLLSLWGAVLLMGPLGWLFAPVAAIRTVLSLAQSVLNVRLGRRLPLERQDRLDWLMVAGVFAGAYFAAGVSHFSGAGISPFTVLPMLVPFSILQMRMVARSRHAALVADMRPATLVRLEDYRRLERGEPRAA